MLKQKTPHLHKQKRRHATTKTKKAAVHRQAKRNFLQRPRPRYKGEVKSVEELYTLYPVSPTNPVPASIARPSYILPTADGSILMNDDPGQPSINPTNKVVTYNEDEITTMRHAGAIASHIRSFAGSLVRPGITTNEIDFLTHQEIIRLGAYPSPLGYHNFPKSLCTSVNNVICHGIPDERVLKEGDIINCDITIYIDGFHSDCSATFAVGDVDARGKRLMSATKESLDAAIALCYPGQNLNEIGRVVEEIANREEFGVCPSFCGHGIGREFHLPPQILHAKNNFAGKMHKNMVFTIEPIMNETPYSEYLMHNDNWTVVTIDGARSAQYEETVLITESGAEILTQHKPGYFDVKL